MLTSLRRITWMLQIYVICRPGNSSRSAWRTWVLWHTWGSRDNGQQLHGLLHCSGPFQQRLSPRYQCYTPFTRSSWLDELAQRASYVLAGRASSMFARHLLDVCWMSARRLLDVCLMFFMFYACFIFARCLLDVCLIV